MTDTQSRVGDANGPAADREIDDAVPTVDLETTAYADDGALVICDRSNPNAWIRSSTLATMEP